MQFGYGVLVWDRTFFAPLYTLVAFYTMDSTVVIKAAISWLKSRLEVRRTLPCGRLVMQREALFRVDAKAEGNNVAIGGWLPFRDSQNKIVKEKSPMVRRPDHRCECSVGVRSRGTLPGHFVP